MGYQEIPFQNISQHGVERGYVQYILLIVFILLGSCVIGLFHAPYIKSYIRTN